MITRTTRLGGLSLHTCPVCPFCPAGWFVGAALENRNGELGDQTQVWRHHTLLQDPLARPGADHQGPGL